ncbi:MULTISPECIES: nucleoside triphosphate pyrophosphohydrolase [unclassified Pseudovibrio]|uniref:nucleoside triphosphate pyrophosphohydrolase n=1 Tax=unclassified Pseudovibrio TaxID=2627060 RepID=UPI0007AE5163|nr:MULTISPECIES: nucleoside triphosphate pyrophosphohydrolase [unclassified Pseudovibrio]KZK98546.1 Nucleoside triphosphate pyrophosphohydrolase [Pseudovibrio sp. W74]KZL08392.1 Nucleoside triphosphate pyrophosphohydrolase [Pseudovibrio sp. Ad14]
MLPSRDISRLIEIMKALRTPETGCPWDLEQNFKTISPYTIEEAYEVADAIEREDLSDLKEELGDLLLQVIYHSRMAEEEDAFAFGDVVEAITKKMIRRHPHVFGDDEQKAAGFPKGTWDRIKEEEKQERKQQRAAMGLIDQMPRFLDEVPSAFPALTEAEKLQHRASKVGFDWGAAEPVLDKIKEEVEELTVEVTANTPDRRKIEDELGDVLFAIANLARHLEIQPEAALKRTNAKFRRRFAHIEDAATAEQRPLKDLFLDEMEAHWQAAKKFDPAS